MVASDAAATETLESSRRRVWAAVLPQLKTGSQSGIASSYQQTAVGLFSMQ